MHFVNYFKYKNTLKFKKKRQRIVAISYLLYKPTPIDNVYCRQPIIVNIRAYMICYKARERYDIEDSNHLEEDSEKKTKIGIELYFISDLLTEALKLS